MAAIGYEGPPRPYPLLQPPLPSSVLEYVFLEINAAAGREDRINPAQKAHWVIHFTQHVAQDYSVKSLASDCFEACRAQLEGEGARLLGSNRSLKWTAELFIGLEDHVLRDALLA